MTRFSDAPVVVPVDMSAESLAAVDVALQIADSANRIHVLRILHEPHSSHQDALGEAIDHLVQVAVLGLQLGQLLLETFLFVHVLVAAVARHLVPAVRRIALPVRRRAF